MNPDDTLNAIDAALEGWNDYDLSVSPDAMRWAPDEPALDSQELVPISTGGAAVGYTVYRPSGAAPTPEQMQQSVAAFRHIVQRNQAGLLAAMRMVAAHVSKTIRHVHVGTAPLAYGDDYRRHRRRCRFCNPAGNPKPLTVDGADYHRRRKNRNKRRRG